MDYKLLSKSGNDKVKIVFSGCFQGIQVDWNAEIITLKRYYKDILNLESQSREKTSFSQFIDIPVNCESSPCKIIIGLNLDGIDEPTILKTIIMINNYRNLCPGRHEFGNATDFQF